MALARRAKPPVQKHLAVANDASSYVYQRTHQHLNPAWQIRQARVFLRTCRRVPTIRVPEGMALLFPRRATGVRDGAGTGDSTLWIWGSQD